MPDLTKNYANILAAIEAEKSAISSDASVQLLAVSKQKPASDIRILAKLGQCHFGENYLQEALDKQSQLADLDLVWHYIGHIQRNKTREIATHFDWVHTVERAIIAKRLNTQRGELQIGKIQTGEIQKSGAQKASALNVCIQVNIDNEKSKSGCAPEHTLTLAEHIYTLEHLQLRGLMVLPNPNQDTKAAFKQTKVLFNDTKQKLSKEFDVTLFDTLSMGMSSDFDKAIAHGATFIRVGTGLFGQRPTKNKVFCENELS